MNPQSDALQVTQQTISQQDESKITQKIDSLRNVIENHQIKGTHFSDILTSQTTIFSAIVGAIFFFGGFVSYLFYHLSIKKRINDFEKEISHFSLENKKINAHLNRSTSNIDHIAGNLLVDEKTTHYQLNGF